MVLLQCAEGEMSDSTTVSDSEDLELKEEEERDDAGRYSPPISAMPPKVVLQEESQVEVSASPAFQCLDEVS